MITKLTTPLTTNDNETDNATDTPTDTLNRNMLDMYIRWAYRPGVQSLCLSFSCLDSNLCTSVVFLRVV
eukprot:m.39988 g.39988  ORF g.39988 m.39988 type:complete len:69 (-) comp18354_c0_seq1:156-362(-)